MADFIANSQLYNIVTENEVASILSHFESDYIISIVNHNIQNRFTNNTFPVNIVESFEQNFKQILSNYQGEFDKIQTVRNQTYQEIIDTICLAYNLDFRYSDDIDIYSAASYLYDFFVCNFMNHMVDFISMFIYKERTGIYDSMNLSALKKSKNSSTIYGKKLYKDIRIAVINANIDYVISNMRSYDISFDTILNMAYPYAKVIANFIGSLVTPRNDFYTSIYVPALESSYRPELLTSIRIKIQQMSISVEQNNGGINDDEIE